MACLVVVGSWREILSPPFRALPRTFDCFFLPRNAARSKNRQSLAIVASKEGCAFGNGDCAGGGGIGIWSTAGCERLSDAGGPEKVTLHLETFVLNLADPGQRSYLRVGMDLGLTHELAKESAPVGQVRDTILGVLGEAKVDELVTARGKARLKEELLRALQLRVPGLGVEEVYFSEFLIQR